VPTDNAPPRFPYENSGVPPPRRRLPRHARVAAQLEGSFESFFCPRTGGRLPSWVNRVEFHISPACPVRGQSRKWRSSVWIRRKRAFAHPDAPWLRQNNPTRRFRWSRRANQRYQLAPSFPDKRGVSRSEGMRWRRQRRRETVSQGESLVSDTCAQDERRFSVRQNRVVLAPVAGVKLAEAKSTQPSLISLTPPMTVARRIRRRGVVKPLRGNAGVPPLNLYARVRFFLCIFAHETAGAACARHSLLPLFWRARSFRAKTRAERAARSRRYAH
jgi:hypothetical protein